MPNRINQTFAVLQKKKKKAFIAFLTAGYPDLATTVKLVPALEEAGADLVELGIPFSDPIADGPTIQFSSACALEQHLTLTKIFTAVREIRQRTSIPLIFMTYYNPVFHYGLERFLQQARKAGIDGMIVPDLPVEEAGDYIVATQQHQIATNFFCSPTTSVTRAKDISAVTTGFIYYISLAGVTGVRAQLPAGIVADVKALKNLVQKPVCVGFGISQPSQVQALSRVADGVIVGSAIIKEIQKAKSSKQIIRQVSGLVRRLSRQA